MCRYHKHLGTKFRCSNFLSYNCTEVFEEINVLWTNLILHVSSSLMYSLHAIVICQNYFRNIVISSKIPPFCAFTCNEALYSVVVSELSVLFLITCSNSVNRARERISIIMSHIRNAVHITGACIPKFTVRKNYENFYFNPCANFLKYNTICILVEVVNLSHCTFDISLYHCNKTRWKWRR